MPPSSLFPLAVVPSSHPRTRSNLKWHRYLHPRRSSRPGRLGKEDVCVWRGAATKGCEDEEMLLKSVDMCLLPQRNGYWLVRATCCRVPLNRQ